MTSIPSSLNIPSIRTCMSLSFCNSTSSAVSSRRTSSTEIAISIFSCANNRINPSSAPDCTNTGYKSECSLKKVQLATAVNKSASESMYLQSASPKKNFKFQTDASIKKDTKGLHTSRDHRTLPADSH